MTEPTLFKPGPATGAMTARQTYVHALLAEHVDGLTASQIGARMHVHLNKPCRCGSDQPCKWSRADAEGVLRSLRKRQLVKQLHDKSGRWVLREHAGSSARPASQLHPETDPFPPGY